MKRLVLILLLFTSLLQAQNLQSYLATATFNSEEGSFLELYMAFDVNTLKLSALNDSFYGEIDIEINIMAKDEIAYTTHYVLKSPSFPNIEENNLFFFDQHRIALSNGNYIVKVVVFDRQHKTQIKEHSQEIEVNYSNKIALSDIQLIAEFTNDTTGHEMSKSGMLLTPFVSNYYPQNISVLSYYFEEYNTQQAQDNKYVLNTYIETYQTNTPLFDFNKIKRKDGEQVTSNLLSFDISDLPTGNYNLVCELKNIKNETLIKKSLFFQRSNSFAGLKNNEDINAVSVIGTFAELITDKEDLKLYIDYLYPISSPHENIFAQNQMSHDDIDLMQKFFYNFWKNRNPTNPDLAWHEYHQKVKSVNNDFKNFRIAGYLTDRGRVYLQYGAPNSMHKVENASSTYPYEIWHYYKLNNQTNKKFVFVNADFATNEYRLEYSNVYGEVSNAEWRDKIEQDKSPNFGDTFNNDYINPR
ncbi:MAG: GWxTD domain-containing protein [Bacteroidota bacterium]|nr:GWxTD domain-containing protein [Bacteroidota bacterium]